MPRQSAGLLAYHFKQQVLYVLLIHPGGPFYAKKDEGVWSIPKGEYNITEDALSVAKREFTEETGNIIASKKLLPLSAVKLKSGKIITAWAVEANFEQPYISSNHFEIEWPPGSGKTRSFPEADTAKWFTISEAIIKIHPTQLSLLEQLQKLVV